MRPLTPKLKREIDENPYFKVCARRNDDCDGRITIEHAFIYAGRQINEIWALLPLCEYHHSIGKHMEDGELDKRMNQLLCLRRATREDLKKYPNVDWEKLKNNLENYARKTSVQGDRLRRSRERRGSIPCQSQEDESQRGAPMGRQVHPPLRQEGGRLRAILHPSREPRGRLPGLRRTARRQEATDDNRRGNETVRV